MAKDKTPKSTSNDSGSTLVEVKLPADSLEIGMHVTRLDRPWTEVPVLLQGLTIETRDDMDLLQEYCTYVYIEIEKEFWLESGIGTIEDKTEKAYPGLREKVEIHDEMPRAKLTLEKTQDHIDEVMNNIANGETFDVEESRQAVRSCMKSIISNANALLYLSTIKDQDQYTSEHSVRVGILSIAFGRFLDLPEGEMELLGLCGMLHDVGKVKVPLEILNKPGKLTRIEYEIMKQHAVFGKEVLEEVKNMHNLVVDTAHYHHERMDGKGYPENLNASFLHKYIRMVSIADVYDAITSARQYKSDQPAFDALKILFAEANKHFDRELVEAFIRMIGIYPPGTLVEMTNGEVGIVVSSNPNARLRPKVELVLDADKKLRQPYIIDLSKDVPDTNGRWYAIKEGLSNHTYGVDVKDYVMKMK